MLAVPGEVKELEAYLDGVISLQMDKIIILGVAMVVFTVLAWLKDYWTTGARIHYTLVTADVFMVE